MAGFLELNNCPDVATLRGKLYSLLVRFGAIARLDIIDSVQAGRRQALCFWRMESVEQEKRLAGELGVGRFGGDLVLVVDLTTSRSSNSTHLHAVDF